MESVKKYCEYYEKLGHKFVICKVCRKIVREIKPLGSMNNGPKWESSIGCQCKVKK